MNKKDMAQLATILKFKELIVTLETFGWTIEFWEFNARILDKDKKEIATISDDVIDWKVE